MESERLLDDQLQQGLTLDREIKSFWQEAARWAKFLSILGFIGITLTFAMALALFFSIDHDTFFSRNGSSNLDSLIDLKVIILLIYFGIGLFFLFPILYLNRFATNMQHALRTNNQSFLRKAVANLSAHYKFIGVFFLIILVLYALVFVVGILFTLILVS